MSAQALDGTADPSPLTSLEAPLTAAGNFLAGVGARAHGLTAWDEAPVEAHERLLEGIEEAIAQLQRAADVTRELISRRHAAPALPGPGAADPSTAR